MKGNSHSATNDFSNVLGAVEDLKQGKVIILVDSFDRENEGDLIIAAEKATDENLNFMLKNAGGLMCMPCDGEILDRLNIHPMVERSTDKLGTPFTVSVDAVNGTTTGMSVSDRVKTIKTIISSDSKPEDLARPGHLFPLRANKQGLFGRQGHTEGSVTLAKLAGFISAAVIMEIMADDGKMARMDSLRKLAEKHDLRIVSIGEIISFLEYLQRSEECTVIILSAGKVPESIFPSTSNLTHAMVPINGKPVIYWSLHYLLGLGFRKFVIVAHPNNHDFINFVENTFGKLAQIDFVYTDHDLGPGYSLKLTEKFVRTPQALLVLGDTLFKFDKNQSSTVSNQDFVLYQTVDDPQRWSLIETDDNGLVRGFLEKNSKISGKVKALIGVYKFSDSQLLFKALDAVQREHKGDNEKLEISFGLEKYRHFNQFMAMEAAEWLDVGHLDNLLEAKRKLLLSRPYNQTLIDSFRGVVVKKSSDSKFFDEVNYYRQLPEEVVSFFPNIIKSTLKKGEAILEMEYYGYPTLGELFTFGNLNLTIWKRILTKLFAVNDLFTKNKKGLVAKENLDDMYIGKTLREFAALKKQSDFFDRLLSQKTITINNNDYQNFEIIWPTINKLIQKITTKIPQTFIHGDFYFGNILYDLNSGVLKFVDPRGSFGNKGVYGDIRYDVAKLYHSVHGAHDFIINDLFKLNETKNGFEFEVLRTEENIKINDVFEEIFFTKYNKAEILLIEGLMFISQTARHYENFASQKAFYLTGVKCLNEALELFASTSSVRKREKSFISAGVVAQKIL